MPKGLVPTGLNTGMAWWPSSRRLASNAKYTIVHDGGSDVVTVNQRSNGGQWNLLGNFTFSDAQTARISLSDNANNRVSADAIRLLPVP